MATEMRKTGIDVVGDVSAWGAHFCLSYEKKEDLLDTLISYCKSDLESGEYCLWIVAEPLRIEEATDAPSCLVLHVRLRGLSGLICKLSSQQEIAKSR